MSKDMRFIKFEMMIGEIYAEWSDKELAGCLYDEEGKLVNDGYPTVWMAAIYDYHKLNDYGKMIMDQVSKMTEEDEKEDSEHYSYKKKFLEKCQDMEFRIKFAKALAADLKASGSNKSGILPQVSAIDAMFGVMGAVGSKMGGAMGGKMSEAGRVMSGVTALYKATYTPKLHFLFWALMILAVDDTDKEEYLSRICDLAQMMEVAEAELMDMVSVIKAIFNVEGDYTFQTLGVSSEFANVIKRYGKEDRVEEAIRTEQILSLF